MGKFIRRLLMGAAIVWGVKSLQDKRREWSERPTTEIREDVRSKLPATLDEEAKDKIADKVVQAVKGQETGDISQKTVTPPPETPMSTTGGTGAPPPPPAATDQTT